MKNSNLKVVSLLALTFVMSNVCSANQFDSLKTQIDKINQRVATAEKSGYIQAYHQLKNLLRDTKELIPGFELNLQEITSQQDLAPYKAINFNNHIAEIRQAIDAAEAEEIARAEELAKEEGQAQTVVPTSNESNSRLSTVAKVIGLTTTAVAAAAATVAAVNQFTGDGNKDAEKNRLAEVARLTKEKAVTKIQAVFRGHQVRKADDALFIDAEEDNGTCELLTKKEADLDDAEEVKASQVKAQSLVRKIGSSGKNVVLKTVDSLNPVSRSYRAKNHTAAFINYLRNGQVKNTIKSGSLAAYDAAVTLAILTAMGYAIPANLAPESLTAYLEYVTTNVVIPYEAFANKALAGLSTAAAGVVAQGQILYANHINGVCLPEESPGTCDAAPVEETQIDEQFYLPETLDNTITSQENTWSNTFGTIGTTVMGSILTLAGGGLYMNMNQ